MESIHCLWYHSLDLGLAVETVTEQIGVNSPDLIGMHLL